MQNSKFKIILIVVACLGFIGFLCLGYWYKTEGPAMAIDYNTNTEIICEEPIPVGIAIDITVNFLDRIYQLYQGDMVKTASKQIDDLMGEIGGKETDGMICDFNTECKAQVGTGGPDMTIGARLLPGVPGAIDYTYTVPACKLKEATGNPCPNLSPFVKDAPQTLDQWLNQTDPDILSLDGLAKSLEAQAQNIHDLFSVQNATVPYGLAEKGEVVGETKISEVELVRRYIKDVENWVTPNPQKNTCALSELDRKRIEQGKMGDKFPMQCMDALAKNMYTPKAWSEECQDECETFTQECKNCLAKCNGKSVYASLNCKIYSQKETDDKCAFIEDQSKKCCGKFCADGLNAQCKECLCAGTDPLKPLSQEQCLDWICGGSKANWVCCHEEPIQTPMYYATPPHHPELEVSDQNCGESCIIAKQEAGPIGGGYTGNGEIFLLSAYGPPCFRDGQCTGKGTAVGLSIVAALGTDLKPNTTIKFNVFTEAKKVNGIWTYKYKDGQSNPIWNRIVEDTQVQGGINYCVCDVGVDIGEGRIDIWLPSNGEAKTFGMRYGEVEVTGTNTGCCGQVLTCCDESKLKSSECQEETSPYGAICLPDNLKACYEKDPRECDYFFNKYCNIYYTHPYNTGSTKYTKCSKISF